MPPQAESITLALRRRVASKRPSNDEPALAYDLRRRGTLAEWLPTAKNLMDKSRWLKWRVALQCGTRKGELVGGANADVNEVCVLCQCDECLQRSSRLPNVGSVPGTAWGRLMTLEGFYEHGMDETLDPDIDEEDSAALCYEYVYARLPGGDDMVRLRDWTRRVFAEHGCAGCLMGKRLHMFWYGDAHNGRIGRWHAARVIDWDRDAGLIKILYEEADYVLDKETRTATGGERTPRWVALGLNFIHWGRPPPVVPEHAWRPLSLPPYEKEQAALVETSSSEEDEDNAEGGGDDGEEDRDMAGTSAAAAAAGRGRVSEPGARRRDGDGGAGKSEEAHRGGARSLGQAAASRFGKGQAGARQRGTTAAEQEDEDEEVEVLVSVRGPAVERAATAIRQGKDAAAAAATTLGRQDVAVAGRGAGSSRATAVGAPATVRLPPATFPSRDAAPARGAAKAPAVAAAAQAPDASPQHAQQQQQRHRQQHPQQQLRRQQARGGMAGAQDPQGAREEAADHAGTSEGVGEHGQQEAHGAVPAHQHQQRLEGTPSCRGVDSAGAGMGSGGGEGAIGSGVRPRRPAAAAAANPRLSPLAAEARTGAASEGSFLDVPMPVVLGKRAWRQQDAAAPTVASMDSAAGAATAAAAAAAGQAAIMPQSSGLRPHPPRCSADRGGSSEALPTTCLPSQQQQQQQQQGGATASVPAQLQPLSAARALGCTAPAAADTRSVAATAPTAAATTAGAARFRPDALAALADMAMAALQAQREARRGPSGAPAVAAAAPAPAMAAAATAAVQHPPSGAGAPQAACKGPRRLGSLRDPIMKAQGALAGATAAQGAAMAAADGSGSEDEAPRKRHCSSSLSFWAAVSGSPLGPGGNGPLEGGVGVSAVAASGGAAGAGREQEDAPASAGLVKGGEGTQPEGMNGEEEERGRDGMDVDEGDGVQEHGGEGKGMEGATASEQAALGSPPQPDQGKAAVGGGDDDLAVGGAKDVDPLASPGPVAAAVTSAGQLDDVEGPQASHGLRQRRGGEDIDAAAGRKAGRGADEEEEEVVEEDAGKGGTDAGAPTGVSSVGNHLLLPGRQDEYYDEREEKAQVLIAQQRVLLEGPEAAAPQHAAAEPSHQGGGNGDGWRAVLHALGLPADAQPLPGNAPRSPPPAMTHMLRGISQMMAAMGAPAACVQQAMRKARASPTQTFFVYEAVLRHVRQHNVEWTTRLLDEMCHGTWSHALWLQSRRQTEQLR